MKLHLQLFIIFYEIEDTLQRYSIKLQTICTHDLWNTKSPACHVTAPVHIIFCVHPVNSTSAAKNQNNNATVYVFTKPKNKNVVWQTFSCTRMSIGYKKFLEL